MTVSIRVEQRNWSISCRVRRFMKKETEAGVQKKEKSKDKMASPDSTFLDICAPEAKLYLCPSSGSVVKPP